MDAATRPLSPARSLSAALDRGAARISALSGWKRRGAAFAAGVAAALAQAPVYALPLLVVGFSALLLLLDGASSGPRPRRSAFLIGWLFGFGYFIAGIYWMAFSFFVEAEQFAWMAPFAVTGLPAFLSLFWGAMAAAYVSLRPAGPARALLFAALFMLAEYARGHVLTGLPWNLPGQALAGTAAGAQSAALYGVYGLSLVALFGALAPAASRAPGCVLKGAVVSLAIAAALFGAGAIRLALPGPGVHADVAVRIVQPNIPQREKFDEALWGRNVARHLELSKGPAAGRLYVLWPENAVSLIEEIPSVLEALDETLPAGAVLLSGTVRREARASGGQRYFNSIAVVAETQQGRRAVAHYDKHHLVPFGEYLPLSGLLRAVGLAQLAPFEEGFTKGVGPRVISAGGPAFAPLVCYEAIFPGDLYPEGERPDWLVTVTNDAWFGDTSGPRQHLDQARLRAIETGLPMARSANTGISALIDARGVYVGRIPLYEAGVFDAPLPKAAAPTLYARFGDLVFFVLLAAALAAGLARGRKTA